MSTFPGECRHTRTKYVSKNRILYYNPCTFGLSPTYVDNHRNALGGGRKERRRQREDWLFPTKSFCSTESQSALSVMCKV
ncbi:hypothetical protein TNCV_1892321 [Trichonephila clavipes]|nr:hypothetical protein TNCV_1892321 [Trichonephila clavipes]